MSADNLRRCPTCGALLHPEPDLRRQFRESQRDAIGKPHLQSAAVLGRFKCRNCGDWSEHPLWEVSTQGSTEEEG
jgi:DNA-directed RNA polymerase subunit M/transcription elongation factor TFIIS